MLVPKLRFKEFTDEWKIEILGKSLSYIVDNRGKNPDYYCDNGIPVIDNFLIQNNRYPILNKANRFIDSDTLNTFIRKRLEKDDVLITLVGNGIGNLALAPEEPSVIIQNTLAFRPNNNMSKIFLYYLLLYNQEIIKKLDRGMAQPSIRQDEILNIKISFPNKKEQNKIATFLSLLDKKIELQTKKIEVLKLYKKGINNIILNYNDHSFKIKDLIVEYNNKTTINNQYNILSSTANGIVLQNTYFNKQTASNNNIGYKIVPKGYITYRSMSDTGEFHFNIQNIIDNGIVSPAYPVFQVKNDLVNKEYFINYINECQDFKNKILSAKEGGTRFALSLSKLSSITVNLPSIEKQNHYSKLLLNLNKKIECEEKKLYVLQLYKKGLMQNMFV